ncbi:Ribosomal RNA-processing protein 8 [Trachymyrmex cornetzi]|uniref:Ribosomal RNA-processing protein 8 n=1 Tax=Trachymyrmex cornetzi TaxID=471704 RepID=A0A195E3T8_9HYME|nr:Ribosomal RNA-processing protein 8 [Trachymyrmex cornetzi]
MEHKIKNKCGVNDMKKSDILMTYSKDDEKTSEVFQELSININNKSENKKKNNRKLELNLEYANKTAVRVDDVKEKNKKLERRVKGSINFEHKMTKIEKLKKITGKKMKRMSAKVEAQHIKNKDELLKLNKHMRKIKQLEEMLARKSEIMQTLKDRVTTQLKATRFKVINEILCNNNSSQSKHYFKQNPDAFKAYQIGYKWQLEQWTTNPLDVIISSIIELFVYYMLYLDNCRPMDNIIADFGCGEAQLAASVPHVVHSFDFIALNDRVKACDMASTSLQTNSIHVVVFCLSLIGSNLNDYIIEANRILKDNGILKIVEMENRFEDVKDFIRLLRNYGFKNTRKNLFDLFYFMDFKKAKAISTKKTLPPITLKSCSYKKR